MHMRRLCCFRVTLVVTLLFCSVSCTVRPTRLRRAPSWMGASRLPGHPATAAAALHLLLEGDLALTWSVDSRSRQGRDGRQWFLLHLQSLQRESGAHDAGCSLQGLARVRGPDRGHGARKKFETSYHMNLRRRQADASISESLAPKEQRGTSCVKAFRDFLPDGRLAVTKRCYHYRTCSRSWAKSGTWCAEAVRVTLPAGSASVTGWCLTLGPARAHGPDRGLGAPKQSETPSQRDLPR